MHSYGQGDRGPAVAEIRSILVHLGLLDAVRGRAATRAEFDHPDRGRRPHVPAEPWPLRGRQGRRRDVARARRGPVAARRPHALPRDAGADHRRRRTRAAGATARNGVRRRPRRRRLRRPDRARPGRVPARGGPRRGRRLRTADHGRTAAPRPQGDRRQRIGAAGIRAVPACRPDAGRQDHRDRSRPRRLRPRRRRPGRSAALDRGRPRVRHRQPAGRPPGRRRHAGPPHPRPEPARRHVRSRSGHASRTISAPTCSCRSTWTATRIRRPTASRPTTTVRPTGASPRSASAWPASSSARS